MPLLPVSDGTDSLYTTYGFSSAFACFLMLSAVQVPQSRPYNGIRLIRLYQWERSRAWIKRDEAMGYGTSFKKGLCRVTKIGLMCELGKMGEAFPVATAATLMT
jgi:hypothetical protein